MSKLYTPILTSLLVAITFMVQAQNISNADFAKAIRAYCPTCIDNSNNLTAAAATTTTLDVSYKGTPGTNKLTTIEGIQYFTSLNIFHCESNSLTTIPTLPTSLSQLWAEDNMISSLPTLHTGITILGLKSNNLSSLPTLPSTLNRMNINFNHVSSIPSLPEGFESLSAFSNSLSSLPSLPSTLRTLGIGANNLSSLPTLNQGLLDLECQLNHLSSLPTLPSSITKIDCSFNPLTTLPDLPSSLGTLDCSSIGGLSCLPILPSPLTSLNTTSSSITCIKNKPVGLSTSLPICNSGGCSYVLPIELASFNATLVDKKVEIKWTTTSEINVSDFVIERSSNNLEFHPLSTLAPQGSATSTTNYTLVDENSQTGIIYYRLKTNDLDGTFAYSKTVSVFLNNQQTWQAFPNPFNERVIIKANNTDFDNALVQIWDMTGREYISKTVVADEVIETHSLPRGVYVLKIIQNGKTTQQKLVKN